MPNNDNILKFIKKYTDKIKIVFVFVLILICGVIFIIRGSTYNQDADNAEYYSDKDDTIIKQSFNSVNSQGITNPASYTGEETVDELIYVYVCGCVSNPGVYQVAKGTRLYSVIEMAGGFLDNSDTAYHNLAEVIADGQQIYVPAEGELVKNIQTSTAVSINMININTATKEQLMTLTGIGESKADDIITYRSQNGGFKRIEDIMNISGIKESAFNKIKDNITV